MPDLSLTELVLAVTSALGVGGTAAGVAKSRAGTPADHEERISKLERTDGDRVERLERTEDRLSGLEDRMRSSENSIASAIARLTESQDRSWQAIERLLDATEEMRETVIRVDTRTAIEAEERARSARKDK